MTSKVFRCRRPLFLAFSEPYSLDGFFSFSDQGHYCQLESKHSLDNPSYVLLLPAYDPLADLNLTRQSAPCVS